MRESDERSAWLQLLNALRLGVSLVIVFGGSLAYFVRFTHIVSAARLPAVDWGLSLLSR